MRNRISRRRLLQAAGAVGVCTVIQPASLRAYAANQKVAVGAIGAGVGTHDAKQLENHGAIIAALCEVDEGRLNSWARNHPNAKLYTDFRKMLDEAKLDGVVVATPDHTHAPISMAAMRRGIHCFCQKPLTHNVFEARRMRQLAEEKKLITQMGTNTQSNPEMLRLRKLIQAGALGDVAEVHVGTDRPIWLQGADRPAGEDPIPEKLNWDLWIGPAPMRPYVARWPKDHPARKLRSFRHEQVYHPFVWRGWWDFGTGALGDIAPHAMNIVFFALELGAPSSVEIVDTSGMTAEMFPEWSILRFDFPARGNQPPVKVFWYDGGKKVPEELGGGLGPVFVGTKNTYPANRGPFRDGKGQPYQMPELAPGQWDRENVWLDWIRGIQTGKQPGCNFSYSGPFTEAYLLGNIALKVKSRIEWDPAAFKITNNQEANQYLSREYRKGWGLDEI